MSFEEITCMSNYYVVMFWTFILFSLYVFVPVGVGGPLCVEVPVEKNISIAF